MTNAGHLLALDAAFGPARACLIRADGARFHAETPEGQPHSKSIVPMLEGLLNEAGLDWRDLGLLAAGIGPGSFTGVRMACAIVAGINASLKRPVLAISSLAVTARRVAEDEVHVVEDARAGQWWTGHYRHGEIVDHDRAVKPDDMRAVTPAMMASETLDAEALPGWRQAPFIRSRAEALGLAAQMALKQASDLAALPRFIEPAYLCPSQAERNASRA